MNKLVKKIACAVMAFTLIAGVFTGCKTNKSAKTTIAMPNYTSVKDPSGNLPEKGTVGDMEYRILKKGELGSYNTSRGYYFDMIDDGNIDGLEAIISSMLRSSSLSVPEHIKQ